MARTIGPGRRNPPSTADLDAVWRPARLPGSHRRPFGARFKRASAGPNYRGSRLHRELPLAGEAHHLVRAAARDLLTAEQLPTPESQRLGAAAAGIVAVHECAGPEIGGLDDWCAAARPDHGVEVIGYWGEAVTTPAQARALMEETGARGLAGDLFIDGALGSRTAWLHEPYADAPGAPAPATSTPTPSKRTCGPVPRRK